MGAHKFIGNHFIIDLKECENYLNTFEFASFFYNILEEIGATVLNTLITTFGQKDAATILYTLSESSSEIHCYPEMNSHFIEIFTCGESIQPQNIEPILIDILRPKYKDVKFVRRGDF